jgi:hypothetical protein
MSTITAILEPDADGSLHLPLPKDLRRGKVKVTATLEPAETQPDEAEAKMEAALAALGRLRELGTFKNDLPLATRNTADFKHVTGLRLIDPFETE